MKTPTKDELKAQITKLTAEKLILEERNRYLLERVEDLGSRLVMTEERMDRERRFYHEELRKTLETTRETGKGFQVLQEEVRSAEEAERETAQRQKQLEESQAFWTEFNDVYMDSGIHISQPAETSESE